MRAFLPVFLSIYPSVTMFLTVFLHCAHVFCVVIFLLLPPQSVHSSGRTTLMSLTYDPSQGLICSETICRKKNKRIVSHLYTIINTRITYTPKPSFKCIFFLLVIQN